MNKAQRMINPFDHVGELLSFAGCHLILDASSFQPVGSGTTGELLKIAVSAAVAVFSKLIYEAGHAAIQRWIKARRARRSTTRKK